MNFGFDIDGTISASPQVYALLIEALHDAGHGIYIITGTMDPVVTLTHYEQRIHQLMTWGIPPGTYTLFIVNAPNHVAEKARLCKGYAIKMMFEDSETYAQAINAAGTLCVLMPKEL